MAAATVGAIVTRRRWRMGYIARDMTRTGEVRARQRNGDIGAKQQKAGGKQRKQSEFHGCLRWRGELVVVRGVCGAPQFRGQ